MPFEVKYCLRVHLRDGSVFVVCMGVKTNLIGPVVQGTLAMCHSNKSDSSSGSGGMAI